MADKFGSILMDICGDKHMLVLDFGNHIWACLILILVTALLGSIICQFRNFFYQYHRYILKPSFVWKLLRIWITAVLLPPPRRYVFAWVCLWVCEFVSL